MDAVIQPYIATIDALASANAALKSENVALASEIVDLKRMLKEADARHHQCMLRIREIYDRHCTLGGLATP
jgi:predicted RNase H-like nuclease (RuvC/YqgF family)